MIIGTLMVIGNYHDYGPVFSQFTLFSNIPLQGYTHFPT